MWVKVTRRHACMAHGAWRAAQPPPTELPTVCMAVCTVCATYHGTSCGTCHGRRRRMLYFLYKSINRRGQAFQTRGAAHKRVVFLKAGYIDEC